MANAPKIPEGPVSREILMTSLSLGVRRDTILVGNRVQSRLATGKGMSVKLCNSEDFPADWSPTMTSCQGASQLRIFRSYENRARRTSGRGPISVSAPQLRSSSMASKSRWVCSLRNWSSFRRVFGAIVDCFGDCSQNLNSEVTRKSLCSMEVKIWA